MTEASPVAKKRGGNHYPSKDRFRDPEIGKQVKAYRKGKKLTLKEFAEIVGCSSAAICKIENAKKYNSYLLAKKIAKAAGIELDASSEGPRKRRRKRVGTKPAPDASKTTTPVLEEEETLCNKLSERCMALEKMYIDSLVNPDKVGCTPRIAAKVMKSTLRAITGKMDIDTD